MKKIIVSIIICIITFGIIFLNINSKENKREEKINEKENISIILETEEGNIETKAFPSKEEYVYDKLVCKNMENTIQTTFDKDTWKLNLSVEEERIDGNFQCNIYFLEKKEYDFDYTGDPQTFTAPVTGTYQIELWGADINYKDNTWESSIKYNGAYTSGKIELNKNEILYIYVGEMGNKSEINGTFNGGGASSKGSYGSQYYQNYPGAGATDVRLVNGSWNNAISLRSRIMVAAGSGRGSRGGGLTSESTYKKNTSCSSKESLYYAYGATQTNAGYSNKNTLYGSFGIGSDGEVTNLYYGSSGGGGGYYGGGGGYSKPFDSLTSHERCGLGYSSGGSSYISGHTGCVAITSESSSTPKSGCTTGTTNNSCSLHYSGKVFTGTIMIDGYGNNWTNVKGKIIGIPDPLGGTFEEGEGVGNGYARIRLVS